MIDDFELFRLRKGKAQLFFVCWVKCGGDSDSGVSYLLSSENMYGLATGDGVAEGVGVQGVILIPAFQFASSYSSSCDFHRGGERRSSLLITRSAWSCMASFEMKGLSSAIKEVVRMRCLW